MGLRLLLRVTLLLVTVCFFVLGKFSKELAIHTIKILIVIPFIKLSGLWIRTVFFPSRIFWGYTSIQWPLSSQFSSNSIFNLVCQISYKVWNSIYALKSISLWHLLTWIWFFLAGYEISLLRKYSSSFNLPFEPPKWCYKLLNRHFIHVWQLWFEKVEWITINRNSE